MKNLLQLESQLWLCSSNNLELCIEHSEATSRLYSKVCLDWFFFLKFPVFFFYSGFFNLFITYLLFIFWLCWVFVSVRGLSLVAASGGHSSSRCAGLSLSRPLLLRSTGSRCAGSVVVAHGPSCSAECGIFPDQGSNPCPLHWQAASQPLRHQGSPLIDYWHTPWAEEEEIVDPLFAIPFLCV